MVSCCVRVQRRPAMNNRKFPAPYLLAILVLTVLASGQNFFYDQSEEYRQETGESEYCEPEEQQKQNIAEQQFDAIMSNQARSSRHREAARDYETGSGTAAASAAQIEMPLQEYKQLRDRLGTMQDEAARGHAPAVVLGSSSYSGKAVHGALELNLQLHATLGQPDKWKTVPIVGDNVVLVKAAVHGKPIPVSRGNGYHVWVTQQAGEVTADARILVPSSGLRGSIEYDFMVARTPLTSFTCRFPVEGLEPQLTAAVQSESRKIQSGTEFTATLRPTARIHLVGFRDMGEKDQRPAKVYAETMNLLSVNEDALELFAVIRYTILYSGTNRFNVLLPENMTVVSADGHGAFRFELEKNDSGMLLKGETAFPIRNSYEISLRLKRELNKQGEKFVAPLPRCREVERESGWLGVEVPGKLRLDEGKTAYAQPIDMRQLPAEILHSSVAPILRAYRYHSEPARIILDVVRLPEMEPAHGSIDKIIADTKITANGDAVTDVRITLRNRLRHTLALKLPKSSEAISALLDGQPLNLNEDQEGQILLPLKRSEGGEQLRPFTVSVVIRMTMRRMGFLGFPMLMLPTMDLPVSSLQWNIYVPGINTYSRIYGDIQPQAYIGAVEWQRPPQMFQQYGIAQYDAAEAPVVGDYSGSGAGAMPVQFKVPKSGVKLTYARYWIESRQDLEVRFGFVRTWLLIPIRLVLVLFIGAGLFLFCMRGRIYTTKPVRWVGMGIGALAAGFSLWLVGWGLAISGICLGIAAIGTYQKWHLPVVAWGRQLIRQYSKRERIKLKISVKGLLLSAVYLVVVMILAWQIMAMVWLLATKALPG
jgi:hypothetical protein